DRLIEGLARYSERQWVQVQALTGGWDKVYGPVLVFRRLWEHLGLAELMGHLQSQSRVEFSLDEAIFAMALHRLLDPGSKRATHHWLETVYRPEFESLELQHLYRSLDHLVRGQDNIEEALFVRNRNLFSLGVELVLFDTTLIHFEGQGPEGLAAFGRPGNYPDCVKVLVGLVLTGDGFPVAHHVFPGNTADITAFRAALKDLRGRFPIERVIVVADRGVVSEEIVEELGKASSEAEEGNKVKIDYILGMRLRRCKEVNEEVLSRAGRYHKVADNLEAKEVMVGDHRYVVCHNSEAEERDRKRRAEIIENAKEELKNKGAQAFVVRRGLRRFVKMVGGELVLKEAAIREEARYDGKWVLRTNADLSTGEVALSYKSLWQIEQAFRELKSGLEMRPVFLRTEDHVRGHIMVCFLALEMESALQRLLKERGTDANYRDALGDLEGVRAIQLKSNGKSWLVRTDLPPKAFQAFKAVGLRPPSHVQPIAQHPTLAL
ncbi:MAG: IS1634 family transposase, partial [Chloroflexota bacterium]|nr:IS1634 family transposase [Chloroflexota bacterium]